MHNLDKKFQSKNVYFYVNRSQGLSTPLLLNDDFTCFENLYNGDKLKTIKQFPFKINKRSPIETHNFATNIKKLSDNLIVHRLWWLLKNTKYFKNVSLIKKLKLLNLAKKDVITYADIIEINEIISNSKQLEKEFKAESNKEIKKTL